MKIPETTSSQPRIFRKLNEISSFVDISDETGLPFEGNKVISLFSGAGGLDIGLERAGFETVACVEIDADCRATLRHNRPSWKLHEDNLNGRTPGDVRAVSGQELLDFAGLRKGEAAIVAGGAPCQSFSNIGKRDGMESEQNGTLFLDFLRLVEGIAPKAVIFENVVGITHQKHSSLISTLCSRLEGLGYEISTSILNAANYGVAQRRERFFLIGLKGKSRPAFPLPTHFHSPIEWLSFVQGLDRVPDYVPARWITLETAFKRIPKNSSERSDYALMNISEKVQRRMEYISQGENFHVLPMNERPNCWKNGLHQGTDTFGRLKLKEPSVTIRTAAYNPAKGRYIHPIENRGLSSHEMAAIQGFPYSWEFKCEGRERVTLVSAGRQIGNAVPPPLAEALGKAVKIQLDNYVRSIESHISSAASKEFTLKESSTAACGML